MSNFEPDDEESVTLAVAAYRLGCNPSTVRALLQAGELIGHRVGKGANPRGIRVQASSIRDYKDRHAVEREENVQEAAPNIRSQRQARFARNFEFEESIKSLRKMRGMVGGM